jgi:Protein kinase domain
MGAQPDGAARIFDAAVELGTPAERAAYLDAACGQDPQLRAEVEELLAHDAAASSFLGSPAGGRPPEAGAAGPAGRDDTRTGPAGPDDDLPLDFLAPTEKPGSLGRLGHYEVQQVIGRGGMGAVLKVFDDVLHRVVAIKVMAPQLAASATARRRFTREGRAQAAVAHDHVVAIHAVEEANGLPYIVMQYLAGESLQDRLDQSGPLPLVEVLRIGMQAASGLAAAHAQGLVHLDVKPANILLENGIERVKLTDFGLARAADDASLTQSGQVAGTPQYMSPEQARGEALDPRTDLFSLGGVLYAMCTGRPPFRAHTSMAVLKRVCEDAPGPIGEANTDIPEWLVAVIGKLHAKDPADRFQSAAEVAELLKGRLAQLQHPSVVAPPAAQKSAGPPPARARRWALAAAVLLCLFGGLGLTEATGVTKLTAVVVRVLTPDGTLVVEVDDPVVKVTVEGDGGLVITGAGPQEVRLRPGSYKVRASKDGKPVREELVTITHGDKRVVRVSLEGEAATAEALGKAAPGAFVILNSKGVQVGKFDTLADAVFDATGGDTIEVRGNGPFACPPIGLGNEALTIRGGNGFRPVIRLNPVGAQTATPLLETNAPLVLEGLELQRSGQKTWEPGQPEPGLVVSLGESLYVSNCRFRIDPPGAGGQICIYSHSSVCVLRNCEFLSPLGHAVSGPSDRIRLCIMDNCLGIGEHGLGISYWFSPEQADRLIQLTRNTLVNARTSIDLGLCTGPKAPAQQQPLKPIRVDATANIFGGTSAFQFGQCPQFLAKNKALAPGEAEAMLLRLLTWRDDRNLYARGGSSLSWGPLGYEAPRGPKNVADWKRFWGTPNADCLEGLIRYQGGNLLAKLMNTPEQLTPEDFRLRPDSAGYRAGKDGKNLGADIDLVGPGPAYERWKKTPEYQQWRKDTGQVK